MSNHAQAKAGDATAPVRAVVEDAHIEPLRRLRWALSTLFLVFGVVAATWAVHLPAIKHATGISTTLLGTVLLVSGAGALVSMAFSSMLLRRFSSWHLSVAAVILLSSFIVPPLAATTFAQAAIGAALFGVALGCADVFLNAAAVSVEKSYGRPIVASFHGLYSAGNVIGSLASAGAFATGMRTLTTALIASACGLAVAVGTLALRRRAGGGRSSNPPSKSQTRTRPARWKIVILSAVAFLLFFCEGSALDWSSLHAQQHLGASASVGAIAFAAIVTTMTVGRFTVDRVALRFGAVRVLRLGTLLAAVGLCVVIISPTAPLTIAGWAIVGVGLAGGVPQVFSAAGNVEGIPGRALSRVVGSGYIAVLVGPGFVGWFGDATSLNSALFLPLAGLLACACLATSVAPQSTGIAIPVPSGPSDLAR